MNVPELLGYEGADLALALDDQAQRHGLDPPGGEPSPHLVPQQRRHLVAHQAVQHPPRLLGVHQPQVDRPWPLKRFPDSGRRDLVEHHPVDRGPVLLAGLQLLGQMPADGLALPVGVGRQVDGAGDGDPRDGLDQEGRVATVEGTIGGVAAMDLNQGVISPGGVGYDIN